MPRRRRAEQHWIAPRADSPVLHVHWYDAEARCVRRHSLGTQVRAEAEIRAAEWVLKKQKLKDADPADVFVGKLLAVYLEEHAAKLPSAQQAAIAVEHMADDLGGLRLTELTIRRQEAYVERRRGERASDGTISRELSVLRAALNRARKRGEVMAVPYVMDVEGELERRQKEPRGRPLTLREMANLIDAIKSDHVRMFCMIAANTLARPEAILDLTVDQIDYDAGLIDLNPAGRRQTKKHRPVVPISATLRPWLQLVEDGHFIRYHGGPVKDIKTAFRALRPAAGLDDQVNPYSFRHTMARELRRRRVSTEELGLLLGHLPRGQARTTSIYAPYDPDYLSGAVAMVDEVFEDLQKLMGRRLVAELTAPLRSSCDPVPLSEGRKTVQKTAKQKPEMAEASRSYLEASRMVGTTGIEPVTPTMST